MAKLSTELEQIDHQISVLEARRIQLVNAMKTPTAKARPHNVLNMPPPPAHR